MKTYKSFTLWLFISFLMMTVISGVQLLVNIYEERMFFVIIYAILSAGTLLFTILFAIDLLSKKNKFMKVKVIEIGDEFIKVLKPNGHKRKIRTASNEMSNFEMNQELILTLTKCTGQIKEINLSIHSKTL